MKSLGMIVVLVCIASACAGAQATQTAQPASVTASLNKSLGVFVFPAKDQKPEQQSLDEQACYSWAVQQSGVDPLNMTPTAPAPVDKSPDGSVVAGAAVGAMGGAIVGSVVHPYHHHGGAAAAGAMVGAMAGAAHKSKKDGQKERQAKQAAAATDKAKIDSFKKAYTTCLQGKGYSVN
jgi:predicted component of type VI protein secretion system